MKKSIQPNFLFIVFVSIASNLIAQDFTNPKLDGYAGSAHAPDFWEMIPYADATCLADSAFGATPDVNDPISYFPIAGNFYSAPAFVSGLHMTNVKSKWHEGIMQTVSGFTPDSMYSINLYQTVVKQYNALDETGSWMVFLDNVLVGITPISISKKTPNSLDMKWDLRTVNFIATSTSHVVKFLPMDDDADQEASSTNISGALRMGLDGVNILPVPIKCSSFLNMPTIDTTICSGETVMLNASIPSATSYLWQNNTTDSIYKASSSGKYSVYINTDDCKVLQQFNVVQQACIKPKVYTDLQMPNIITPNGDGINDVFEVKKIDGIISMHTEIYNRWGVKLFATDNIDVKWDGASCADGVYYWMIKYFDANDEHKTLTGFVNLMR